MSVKIIVELRLCTLHSQEISWIYTGTNKEKYVSSEYIWYWSFWLFPYDRGI